VNATPWYHNRQPTGLNGWQYYRSSCHANPGPLLT
jgi:hypothetical protein